jgi:hypothetical protein
MSAFLRILAYVICLLLSAAGAYYAEPFVKENADAVLILTTVFTVFAGFLVAIITILGDPGLIPEGSWRVAEGRRDSIESQLIAHVWLFVIYLLAIALLFVGVVVRKAPAVPEEIKVWIDRTYLFVGIFSFLLTFGLAKSLLAFQVARIEAEIRRRRVRDGLKD